MYPHVIIIELTNYCNAQCVFCPLFHGNDKIDRDIRPRSTMSINLFQKIVSEISCWEKKPDSILFDMHGEPLLDKKFFERLAIFKEADLSNRVDILTNAEFLSEELSEAIVRSGIHRITIGFDGATKKVYEQHRVGCHYDRVLKNISQFVNTRNKLKGVTRVAIQYVRTRNNTHEVLPAYKLFSEILDESLDCFQDTLSINWGSEEFDGNENILRKTKINPQDTVYCPMLESNLIILVDGSVPACCWDYNLHVLNGPLGNVNRESLLEIWNGELFNNLRKIMKEKGIIGKPKRCLNCPLMYPEEVPFTIKYKPLINHDLVQISHSGYIYKFNKPSFYKKVYRFISNRFS